MWLHTASIQFYFMAELATDDSILSHGQTFAELWQAQWNNLLGNGKGDGSVYAILTNFARFLAVATLLFYLVQQLRDLIDGNLGRPIAAFIWPFLVVVLLANSGVALSTMTLVTRNYIVGDNPGVDCSQLNSQCSINSLITSKQLPGEDISLKNAYRVALDASVGQEAAGSFLRPCEALTGQQQCYCLNAGKGKFEALQQSYQKAYENLAPPLSSSPIWMESLSTRIADAVNYACATEGAEKLQSSELTFNAILGSTWQASLKGFLIAIQYAFQNLIEVAMLMVAILGPLAVGASLLPVGGKPIWAWLTGLISLGIAKLSFNVIAGVTALMVYKAGDSDPMWFMVFIGILAPLVALAIAAAGGFAVFSAISNSASWASNRGYYYGGYY